MSMIRPNLRSMTDNEFEDELEDTELPLLDDETEEDELDGDLDSDDDIDDEDTEDSDMM